MVLLTPFQRPAGSGRRGKGLRADAITSPQIRRWSNWFRSRAPYSAVTVHVHRHRSATRRRPRKPSEAAEVAERGAAAIVRRPGRESVDCSSPAGRKLSTVGGGPRRGCMRSSDAEPLEADTQGTRRRPRPARPSATTPRRRVAHRAHVMPIGSLVHLSSEPSNVDRQR